VIEETMKDKLKPIQPDDLVHITVQDFENNYVSRVPFDALRAELADITADRDSETRWGCQYKAERDAAINALQIIYRHVTFRLGCAPDPNEETASMIRIADEVRKVMPHAERWKPNFKPDVPEVK
jgi:hypothetical protein